MNYFRNASKGRPVSFAICLVGAALAITVLAVLKPSVIDAWHAYRLRSSDAIVRAQTVQIVCLNPTPRAARALMQLFKEEDETASVDTLSSADPYLISYLLQAFELEATWLLNLEIPEEPDLIRGLVVRHGVGMLEWMVELPEEALRRIGTPPPGTFETLVRTVMLAARLLDRDGAATDLNRLGALSDAQVVLVLLALAQAPHSDACDWCEAWLNSDRWIVRRFAIDAMSESECNSYDMNTIARCVRDGNPLVQANLLCALVQRKEGLSRLAENRSLRNQLIDNMSRLYASYLADGPGGGGARETQFGDLAEYIAEVLFECEDVPELIERLSLPGAEREFSLLAIAVLGEPCEVPRRALEPLKKLMSSRSDRLRLCAIDVCERLPEIDDEMLDLLLEVTKSEDAYVRCRAMMIVGDAQIEPDVALEVFSRALRIGSYDCRDYALQRLTDLGEMARAALLRFREAVRNSKIGEDVDPDLLEKVQTALDRLEGAGNVRTYERREAGQTADDAGDRMRGVGQPRPGTRVNFGRH